MNTTDNTCRSTGSITDLATDSWVEYWGALDPSATMHFPCIILAFCFCGVGIISLDLEEDGNLYLD
jgi:hypothetical protein